MTALADQTCIPCQGGIPPLDADGIAPLLAQVPRWKVVEGHHLKRTFALDDFATALRLVNQIGALAETMGHHPDLTLGWGYVGVEVYTHKIDGLHEADFILAAQIDRAFADL
jgi:4a-hydroxytetrahydrobiopterin dehydratase